MFAYAFRLCERLKYDISLKIQTKALDAKPIKEINCNEKGNSFDAIFRPYENKPLLKQ